MTKIEFQRDAQLSLNRAQAWINKFADNVKENPVRYLDNSKVLEYAAQVQVWTMILADLAGEATPESVERYLIKEIFRKAAYPQKSTSDLSDLIQRNITAVQAEIVQENFKEI
jgi:hypothetical protein